ncbi:hypothetical protein ACER0A_001500 [Haloimpatiens sp. FM7315]|uniref:hypothetical protein n=1 Tax=Haloimpatiens sp. FM7315 TaxID=3298609 RepID=UPI0035A37BCB
MLIEYIPGKDLQNFNKSMALGCSNSITEIFNTYWQNEKFEENKFDNGFEIYWKRINKRAKCLKNEPQIASVYNIFVDSQLVCPRGGIRGRLS